MNTQPKFKSNSDIKLAKTTKRRLEGCDPSFKNDCGCKKKNIQINLSKTFRYNNLNLYKILLIA